MKRKEVEMVVDSGGEAYDDLRLTKVVEATDKRAAIDAARQRVREKNPDVQVSKVWAWTVRWIYA